MSNFWSVYSQSPEAAIAGTFDKDGKIKPPEKGQVQDIGKELVEGQVPAMLAGSTSDIVDLAKVLNDLNAEYGGNTQLLSHLAKPLIDKVQSYAGREAFTEGFNKLAEEYNLPFRDDPDNPVNTLGGLISLGGAYKLGKETVESTTELAKEVKNIFKGKGPPMGPQPELAGVGSVDDINTQTNKLLDVKKDITTTNIPNNIPAEEMFNAPKINPTMAGGNTPTGKIQQEKFLQLEEQGGKTPEQLFDETGVYRGEDGKLRWEIDDRDAELLDVDLSVGKKYNLSNLLKFDDLYKEYYKTLNVDGVDYQALKNVEVEFISKDADYRALYNHDRDLIQINLNDLDKFSEELRKEQIISSLLHEVQHAVQRREGFSYGTSIERELANSPNYKEYEKAVKFIKDVNATRKSFVDDNITPHLKQGVNQEKTITYFDNLMNSNNVDGMYYDLERLTTLSGKEIEKFQKIAQEKVNKEIINRALVNQEESLAAKAYADKYGEREARLVQARFEKRLKYKKFMNNPNIVSYQMSRPEVELFSKGKLKDTSFLLGKNPKTIKEKGLKQMGGFDKTTQKMDVQKEGKGISYDLTLYHGSNKNFDKFDSGEIKDAAFGYGINLSNKPNIGKFYGNKLYKTKVSIKPDEILDYDKPINQQPKEVQEKIKKITDDVYDGGFEKNMTNLLKDNFKPEEITGKLIYKKIGSYGNLSDKQVSQKLSEFGIKGLKHKAGFLQGAKTKDSVNYVLFDSDLIDIVGKE